MGPHTYVPRGARTQCAQNPSFPRLSDASSTAPYASSDFSPTLSWPAGSFESNERLQGRRKICGRSERLCARDAKGALHRPLAKRADGGVLF